MTDPGKRVDELREDTSDIPFAQLVIEETDTVPFAFAETLDSNATQSSSSLSGSFPKEVIEPNFRRREDVEILEDLKRTSPFFKKQAPSSHKCLEIAAQIHRQAIILQNNEQIPLARTNFFQVIKYTIEAFDNNEVLMASEKEQQFDRLEKILERLSNSPYSLSGSFPEKAMMMRAMCDRGFNLRKMAERGRIAFEHGKQCDDDKKYSLAAKSFEQSLEFYYAMRDSSLEGKVVDYLQTRSEEMTMQANDLEMLDELKMALEVCTNALEYLLVISRFLNYTKQVSKPELNHGIRQLLVHAEALKVKTNI